MSFTWVSLVGVCVDVSFIRRVSRFMCCVVSLFVLFVSSCSCWGEGVRGCGVVSFANDTTKEPLKTPLKQTTKTSNNFRWGWVCGGLFVLLGVSYMSFCLSLYVVCVNAYDILCFVCKR